MFITLHGHTVKLKQRYLVSLGADQLRTQVFVKDETPEQVSQFTCPGCSISYQFSNDVEFKLAKYSQLMGTTKRAVFKKVRTENILKIHNTPVLPTFLYGSENWTLAALTKTKN
jgi:hypothetical protein